MHLYANSMNLLTRLQTTLPSEHTAAMRQAAEVRRTLAKRAFQLHHLGEDGFDGVMAAQWDGDARRQPGRNASRAPQAMRAKEEVPVVEPVSFWG
jgi:hypothetical protein